MERRGGKGSLIRLYYYVFIMRSGILPISDKDQEKPQNYKETDGSGIFLFSTCP